MRKKLSPFSYRPHMIDDFPAKRLVLLDWVGLIQYAVMLVGAKAATSETIWNIVHSQTIENIVRIDGIVHKKTSLTDDTSTIEFIRIIDLTSDAVHAVFHSFSAGDIFTRLQIFSIETIKRIFWIEDGISKTILTLEIIQITNRLFLEEGMENILYGFLVHLQKFFFFSLIFLWWIFYIQYVILFLRKRRT